MPRFDDALMQPPVPGPVDAALLRRVAVWCRQPERGFAVACIAPDPGLDAVACELDGSHALAAMPRWRGLLWRVQVVMRDRWADGDKRLHDPWDAGWWRDGELARAAAFRPRRPTLLMVRESASVDALLATLESSAIRYRQPVRVLVVTTQRHACLEAI